MITAAVYAESGGTYKTTTTANLGVAYQRMGLDTLLIDMDAQKGNLSALFAVGDDSNDPEADNLVKHILEQPDGDFEDLIESTDEGVDIIPAHDMLSDFTSNLEQKINYETSIRNISREDFNRYSLLYELLWEREGLHEQYDAVLIDPNARAEDLVYNAIYALRTLIAPVEPAGKGNLSLGGLEELVTNMESELGIQIGLSCVIPTAVSNSNAHQAYTSQFKDSGFSTPVVIGDRKSLMDAMWGAHGSAFKTIEERWKSSGSDGDVYHQGERRVRDREIQTIQKLWQLAGFIATETFDEEIDGTLILNIEGREPQTFEYQTQSEVEV